MGKHVTYPTWNSLYKKFEKREAVGVEPTAGNWPTYFLRRNRRGEFTDFKGEVIEWEIKDPSEVDFTGKELTIVRSTLNKLTAKQKKIAKYYAGLPTSNWSMVAGKLISAYQLSPPLAARLLSALHLGISDTLCVVWHYKYLWDVARPIQLDPSLKTVICTPRFPSYVSGHAAVAGCANTILSHFFPHEAEKLHGIAEEDAASRLFAGVHFHADNEEGVKLGTQIGEFVVSSLNYQKITVEVQKSNKHANLSTYYASPLDDCQHCESVLDRHIK
ncbi:vanadium-dependent haloperoxidase [Fictibacillus sp. WQ 8-8]|uniref:vanadium-dependent haloperoxidase n=1 Tax=Fictibacillus sp. WQ 8-8 TaxID=2938788 RepID=UPI00210A65BC|nr:vanadium-dependent haloperoxidase [Fictibacillus sp. WQ 8-8]MCQ6267228.1 vanadium-dependent haloperoxidase [Fictibacillus sp. WQ 8-8]